METETQSSAAEQGPPGAAPKLCLVTGVTGYIGGRLVPELLAAGLQVRVLNSTNPGTDLLPTGLPSMFAGLQAEVWALLWQPQNAEPQDTKLLLIVSAHHTKHIEY